MNTVIESQELNISGPEFLVPSVAFPVVLPAKVTFFRFFFLFIGMKNAPNSVTSSVI